jgi:hypothetical protein
MIISGSVPALPILTVMDILVLERAGRLTFRIGLGSENSRIRFIFTFLVKMYYVIYCTNIILEFALI